MGADDVESTILRDVLPGVDVLTKGSLPSHPSELLMSERFDEDARRTEARATTSSSSIRRRCSRSPTATVIGKHAGTTPAGGAPRPPPVQEIGETMKRLRTAA